MKNLWLANLLILLSFQVNSQIDLSIIAKIESNNDTLAINKFDGGSRGIYQIHPSCLKEYNRVNNTKITLIQLFNKDTNKKIAYWMFNKRIPELLSYYKIPKNTKNILISYNAGIGYLIYKKKIPKTTLLYIKKYEKIKNIKRSN